MKITTQTIRRIIKEELRKVLAEDLYDDPQEKEEAIKNLMAKFNMSREDAEAAIVGVDKEMMGRGEDYQEFQKEKDEKQKAVRSFKNFAEQGKTVEGFSEEQKQEMALDFSENPQKYRHPLHNLGRDGYDYCMKSRFEGEEYEAMLQRIGTDEEEMRKNPLFRDLETYNQLKQGNLDLDSFQDEVQSKCFEDLGHALVHAAALIKQEEVRNKEIERKRIQKAREEKRRQENEIHNSAVREKTKVLPENAMADLDSLEQELTSGQDFPNIRERHRKNILNAIGNLKIVLSSDGFSTYVSDREWLPELANLLSDFHYYTGGEVRGKFDYEIDRDFVRPIKRMREGIKSTLEYHSWF